MTDNNVDDISLKPSRSSIRDSSGDSSDESSSSIEETTQYRCKKEIFQFFNNYLVHPKTYSDNELGEVQRIYDEIGLNLVQYFEDNIAEPWKEIQKQNDIILWDSMNRTETESKLLSRNEWHGISPKDACEYVSDWNKRYDWDKYLGKVEILYYYSTNNTQISKDLNIPLALNDIFIIDMKTNPISWIKPRYTVLIQFSGPHPTKPGAYVSIAKTITFGEPDPAYIRAECPIVAYLFEPLDNSSCKCTHICNYSLGDSKNLLTETFVLPIFQKYSSVNMFYKIKFMVNNVKKGYKANNINTVNNFVKQQFSPFGDFSNNSFINVDFKMNESDEDDDEDGDDQDENDEDHSDTDGDKEMVDFNQIENKQKKFNIRDFSQINIQFTREPKDWVKYFLEKVNSNLRSFPSPTYKIPIFYEINDDILYFNCKFHIGYDVPLITSFLFDQYIWDPFVYKVINREKGFVVKGGGRKISKKFKYSIPRFTNHCIFYISAEKQINYVLEERDNGDVILFVIEPSIIHNQSMISLFFQVNTKNWIDKINLQVEPILDSNHNDNSSNSNNTGSMLKGSGGIMRDRNDHDTVNNNNISNIIDYLYSSFKSFKSNFIRPPNKQNISPPPSPPTNIPNNNNNSQQCTYPSNEIIKIIEIFSMIIDHCYSNTTNEISLILSLEKLSVSQDKKNQSISITNNQNNNQNNKSTTLPPIDSGESDDNNNNNITISNITEQDNQHSNKRSLVDDDVNEIHNNILKKNKINPTDKNNNNNNNNKTEHINNVNNNNSQSIHIPNFSILLPYFIPKFNEITFTMNYDHQKKNEDQLVSKTNLFNLPHEIIISFLSFLDHPSLCTISRTCKYLKEMAESDILWYRLYYNFFGETRDTCAKRSQYRQDGYTYQGVWDSYVKSNFQMTPSLFNFPNPSLSYFLSKETNYETVNGVWKKDFFRKIRMDLLWKVSNLIPQPKPIARKQNNNNNTGNNNISLRSIFLYSISPNLYDILPVNNDTTPFTSIYITNDQIFAGDKAGDCYYLDFSNGPPTTPIKFPYALEQPSPQIHVWDWNNCLFSGLSNRTVIKYVAPDPDGTQRNISFSLSNPSIPNNWYVGGMSNSFDGQYAIVNYSSACDLSVDQDFDTVLDLFDINTQKLLYSVTNENEEITATDIHKRRFLVGGDSGSVSLRDFSTGEKIISFLGNTDSIYSLKILSGEDIVITSSKDGTVKFFDERAGPYYIKRIVGEEHVKSFGVEPRCILCGSGSKLTYWDPRNLQTPVGKLYPPVSITHADIVKVKMAQFKVMVLYSSGVVSLWDFI